MAESIQWFFSNGNAVIQSRYREYEVGTNSRVVRDLTLLDYEV
jgi:hypothetical protein